MPDGGTALTAVPVGTGERAWLSSSPAAVPARDRASIRVAKARPPPEPLYSRNAGTRSHHRRGMVRATRGVQCSRSLMAITTYSASSGTMQRTQDHSGPSWPSCRLNDHTRPPLTAHRAVSVNRDGRARLDDGGLT